jgi:hypothetical protein
MNDRVLEVRDLVHKHLTAAMLMVPLDRPLDPAMTIADALAYLDAKGFDLALLRHEEVRIIYRPVLLRWARRAGTTLY